MGGGILTGIKATRLIFRDNIAIGVELSKGDIVYGDKIISCLGAWNKSFLKYNGIKIKTYLLSIPIFKFKVTSSELIGLWDDEAYGYWRPHDSEYIIGGGYDGYIVKNPLEGFGKPHISSYNLVKKIFRFRYKFKYFKIVDAWTGTVSFTYSRRPIAERSKKYSGLYIIDGLGGEGLVRGPGLAYDIVEMI
jgi:glycine/D-amino acid oxidase-like deaminating enzyme